jgi:hypothetical protein
MHRTAWVLTAVALTLFAPMRARGGDSDTIFTNGFELLPWYLDVDTDGYGDPASVIYASLQPPARIATAGDCNDADAEIHPGAPDDPDAAFVDSNCDGIDGDITRAVFVAAAGSDSGDCSTPASACATPAYALTQTSTQRTQVYLQAGNYAGPLLITVDAALFGGYDIGWHRGPLTEPASIVRLLGGQYLGSILSLQGQFTAVYLGPSQQVSFADIIVAGPDANVQTPAGDGLSSYAIFVEPGAQLTMDRCQVDQGDGADGATGVTGTDALTLAAAPAGGVGGNALAFSTSCDNTSRGSRGLAGSNTCPSGRSPVAGAGGLGGLLDTSCGFPPNYSAQPGTPGFDAIIVQGTVGQGGPAGSTCQPGHDGYDGAVTDGSGGGGANGSSIIGGLWVSDSGGTGSLGDNGGGGGGGGGSGGCDDGTDAYGAGGGGGGAGGCAARSAGGGGHGGGASFGVYLRSASAVINQTTFNRGIGGRGGRGGVGGHPQPGGPGDQGGQGAGGAQHGGQGGDGGRGGASGGGGGGQGGSVYGVYAEGPLDLDGSGNQFLGGAAGLRGSGGLGGLPGVANGQDGTDGTLGSTGSCTTSSDCN